MNKYVPYPTRDAIKNYFPLPNEIFDFNLHSTAIAIYAYLMKLEDRDSFTCFPSYQTIAKAVGVGSKTTVAKYVRELEDKCLIETEQRKSITKDGMKRDSTLLYYIRPIQEAIDLQNQIRMAQLEREVAIQRAKKLAEEKGVEYHPPVTSVKDGEKIGA